MEDNRRQDYMNYGVALYKAALRGDWEAAKQIHHEHPECFIERITSQGDTALHIAAVARHANFVEQLVSLLASQDRAAQGYLSLRNNIGNTALCLAAASGTVAIAKTMVRVDSNLPTHRGNDGLTPLHMAALLGHRDMVEYLWPLTSPYLSDEELVSLFLSTISTDLYDIALDMLHDHPQLAIVRDANKETPLHILARSQKSHVGRPGIWRKCCNLFSGSNEERDVQSKTALVNCLWKVVLLTQTQDQMSQLMEVPSRPLFKAVELGNVEFVKNLISSYPDLIWKLDDDQESIFHVAVKFRQEKIFRLIYELGAIKDLLATYVNEKNGNSILHLAALLPPIDRVNRISGPALQMQREMLWFTVVEDLVPQLAEAPNLEGETPRAVFTKTHQELRKEGEEWMRKTVGSCSVVATLIASVVFTAGSKPSPISQGVWYWVFATSDLLSLISSTSSILMFLSILTSRYAEKDFLRSLPLKQMIGLTLLFVSIATMMIAFTAAFSINYDHTSLRIVASVIASVPIILFAAQEFPLLLEVYRSTVRHGSVFEPCYQLFPCTD